MQNLSTPLTRALQKRGSALKTAHTQLVEYFQTSLDKETPHPKLSKDLVVTALQEYIEATTCPEVQLDALAQQLYKERIESHGTFARYFITKGRCKSERMVSRREDITDRCLQDISTIASPDHVLSYIYEPSCMYCAQYTTGDMRHRTGWSSIRYLDKDLAAIFDEINWAEKNIDRLRAIEEKSISRGGRKGTNPGIVHHKAQKQDAVQLLHDTIENMDNIVFASTRVIESAHPIIGLTLLAAKQVLQHANGSPLYTITAITNESRFISEVKYATSQLQKADVKKDISLGLVNEEGSYHPELYFTYGDCPIPVRLQIKSSHAYLQSRTKNRLHEEKQLALIKQMQKALPFDKAVGLLAHQAGQKYRRYL